MWANKEENYLCMTHNNNLTTYYIFWVIASGNRKQQQYVRIEIVHKLACKRKLKKTFYSLIIICYFLVLIVHQE